MIFYMTNSMQKKKTKVIHFKVCKTLTKHIHQTHSLKHIKLTNYILLYNQFLEKWF